MTTRRSMIMAALAAPMAFTQDHGQTPPAKGRQTSPMPSADEVLKELVAGNKRFSSGHARHPHSSLARLKETAKGQHPNAVVLTCSDSRVSPEILLDQGIGDIFTVRVAGNVANEDEIASCEYAVEHFNSPVCLVLGHTACGAVTAVVNGDKAPEDIQHLVKHIGEAVAKTRKYSPDLKGPELIAEAVAVNVWESVEDMIKGSEIIARKVRGGQLKLVGGVYSLDTGKIQWLGAYPSALSVLR